MINVFCTFGATTQAKLSVALFGILEYAEKLVNIFPALAAAAILIQLKKNITNGFYNQSPAENV